MDNTPTIQTYNKNDIKPRGDKPFKRKDKRFSKDPRVAYVIGDPKPKGRLPWQLKLQAISDCARFKNKENYKTLVENRYQELLRKEENIK